MKFGVRWNVRGVRPEARDTARKAAQRSGMSVGDWLNEVIIDQAAQDGIAPARDYDHDHDHEYEQNHDHDEPARRDDRAQEFAAVSERLAQSIERIDRRLDNLTTQIQAPAAPAPYRPTGPEAYAPARHWAQPPMQWAPPPPPPPVQWSPPTQYAPMPAADDWSRDVDAAVAEISARQQALDIDPDSQPAPTRPIFAPSEQRPAYPVAYAPPPPPAWIERAPSFDLSGLEQQLRQITEQIQALSRPNANDGALAELRDELREIVRTMTEAMPRQAIEALEQEMRGLTERLAQTHQAGAESTTIGEMARNLMDVRDSLRSLTPAENLAGFADTIHALAHKIDQMAQSGHDAGSLQQLEAAIDALRGVVSHAASNETLASLADEVRGLSMRIEHVAATTADRALGPELEAQLRAFTEQMKQVQAQGESAAFGQLHDRISSLSSKLDASDARLTHLDSIERELRGIMGHLDELRGGGDAARTIQTKAAPVVDALKRDLSRTQESVEAVHGTVDHVVDRLAMIESEMRETKPERETAPIQPAAPKPIPVPEIQTAHDFTTKSVPTPRDRAPIDPSLPPDYPLEPGSGTPQARIVPSAAERIAASEAALGSARPAATAPSNFIAAARRAAQSASPEAVAEEAVEAKPAGTGSLSQRMRRLLGGAAVILVLIGGYRLAPKILEPLGNSSVLNSVEVNQQLAAKALEPDDEEDEPAVAAPETRPVAAPRTVEAVPTWLPPSAAAEVTGSIPKNASATVPTAAPSATLNLPDSPLEKNGPSAKLPAPLREAAAAGDPVAAYDIAMRHLDGRGVPASIEEAARWLQQAAKGGLAPAQFRLGSLYEKGQGVKKNLDAARQLYLAASERGNAKAMHNLAVMHAEGLTGKSDYKTAALWFLKAAQHGVADSQYNLGILYARGIGVEQNLPESYKWFALAAAQGDRDSAKKRDDVATRLDAGALAAARLAVKTFVAEPQPEEAVTVKLPEEARPAAPARSKKRTPSTGPAKISPT